MSDHLFNLQVCLSQTYKRFFNKQRSKIVRCFNNHFTREKTSVAQRLSLWLKKKDVKKKSVSSSWRVEAISGSLISWKALSLTSKWEEIQKEDLSIQDHKWDRSNVVYLFFGASWIMHSSSRPNQICIFFVFNKINYEMVNIVRSILK